MCFDPPTDSGANIMPHIISKVILQTKGLTGGQLHGCGEFHTGLSRLRKIRHCDATGPTA